MPLYDYQCSNCKTRFEATRAVSAAAPPCPQCGAPTGRIILAAPAVHGMMARGREMAARSLPECGKGCRCCP